MAEWKYLNKFLDQHIDPNDRAHMRWNAQFYVPTHTSKTRRATSFICNELADRGIAFACEVKFKGFSRRTDILCPELYETQAIEIMDSESNESILKKASDYKKAGVTMFAVHVSDVENAWNMIKTLNKLDKTPWRCECSEPKTMKEFGPYMCVTCNGLIKTKKE